MRDERLASEVLDLASRDGVAKTILPVTWNPATVCQLPARARRALELARQLVDREHPVARADRSVGSGGGRPLAEGGSGSCRNETGRAVHCQRMHRNQALRALHGCCDAAVVSLQLWWVCQQAFLRSLLAGRMTRECPS